MRIPRIYQDMDLQQGQTLFLSREASHHIIHVLRMKEEQAVILFNGQGGFYDANIQRIIKHQVEINVGQYHNRECESSLHITLVQGISRGQRMDYTLQKAVELGVTEIVPVICRYGNVKPDKQKQTTKFQHWQKIIISACEQTGRNRLPNLWMPVTFDDWLEEDITALKILLHPAARQSLNQQQPVNNHVVLLSGPEGGFSEEEISNAMEQNYLTINLGPRILRTETAALAAISVCQLLWGDFR